MKPKPEFVEIGMCEVCKEEKHISVNGICVKCYEKLLQDRSDPFARKRRLKALAKSEQGIIRFAKVVGRSRTVQRTREFESGLEKQAQRELNQEQAQLKRIIEATPAELTRTRASAPYSSILFQISDKLLKSLKEQPSDLYRIPPETFEELMAELLTRMGFYDVELTPRTRDKGRDILAKFKVPTGNLLTIVECKRWAAARKVGISVIERFLFTIRENDRASCGLIATTSFFSADSKAKALQYCSQLHLADFDRIKTWIGSLGVWQKQKESHLWIPPTA